MEKIIVPIDFSDCSENALFIASLVAKKIDASIHLIHTLNMGDSILLDEEDDAKKVAPYVKALENKFEGYIEEKDFLKGLEISYRVRQRPIHLQINDSIDEVGADLIVMGSHGASGFQEVFVGSNTQKVVRNAKVPVIVIKNKMENFDIDEVVYACDFEDYSVAPYVKAKAFFNKLNINMNLIYVNKPTSFKSTAKIKQQIKDFFGKVYASTNDYPSVEIYSDHSVEDAVMAYCSEIGAKFIGLPTRGRKRLSTIFAGSNAEGIVNHSDYAVVTFKI